MKKRKSAQVPEDRQKKSGKRLGLQGKTLLGLLCSLVVVLLIIGFVLLKQANDKIGQLTDLNISEQVISVKKDTESYFDEFIHTLSLVGGMDNVQSLVAAGTQGGQGYRFESTELGADVAKDLGNALANFPEGAINLFVVCEGNNQLLRSNGTSTGEDYRVVQDPWWNTLKAAGEPIVTGVYETENTQGLVLTVAVPIFQNGKMVGGVGSDIGLDKLCDIMRKMTIGETGYIVAYDGDLKMIFHPDNEMIFTRAEEAAYSENLRSAIVNHEDAVGMVYQVGDETFHGTTLYSPVANWQLIGCMSDAEYLEEIREFACTILFCFLLTAVLLALVALVNVRRMVRPIKRLAAVSESLAQGNLDVEVDTRGNDEISDLATSTSHIVSRLKQYIAYIDEVAAVLEQMANRDLVFTMEQDYQGEFRKLKLAMDNIQASLSGAMFQILSAAEQVNLGSEQMAAGAQTLAQGTTEQAETVERLSESVQGLTDQAGEGVTKALATKDGVGAIGDRIVACNRQMQEMLTAMENIQQHSAKIGNIVKASEDIAFQTNILALNASVEAARAGNAGKGFAVVADEVRSLAGKSADSAKAINGLIQDTINAVRDGASIAQAAAASLDEITQGMEGTVADINEMSDSYRQEAEDLGRITDGIGQVSSVVQSASATAEESAATAEELAGQVAIMKKLVDTFHLDDRYQQM